MATWMELRCDVNGAQTSYEDKCWSSVNAGPMQRTGDTQASVLKTLKALHDQAIRQGWRRIPEGWACPHCRKL